MTAKAPFDRDVNTVFQDYALFPHMCVLDNVAYGLRVRGRQEGRAPRRRRARRSARSSSTTSPTAGRPSSRVGSASGWPWPARSSYGPKVLLLDEPLGALDLKLREQMQVELKQLQRDLGITFVFVTHDQEEALTLSDRIAVFSEGRIVQLGTPREIYEQPASEYVASFVGTSNIFDPPRPRGCSAASGTHALRPEKIALHPPGSSSRRRRRVRAEGVITESIYLGTGHRVHVRLDDGTGLVVLEQSTGGRRAASTAATRSSRAGPPTTSSP